MLTTLSSGFGNDAMQRAECSAPQIPARYTRNEKDDLKVAIDALYEFKRKLDDLHPNVERCISNMLQERRGGY